MLVSFCAGMLVGIVTVCVIILAVDHYVSGKECISNKGNNKPAKFVGVKPKRDMSIKPKITTPKIEMVPFEELCNVEEYTLDDILEEFA